jgi:hypothetical protein
MLKAAAITCVNSPGSLGSTCSDEIRSSRSKVSVRRNVISTRWWGPATLISWLAVIVLPLWTKANCGSFEITNCLIPKKNLPTDSWP